MAAGRARVSLLRGWDCREPLCVPADGPGSASIQAALMDSVGLKAEDIKSGGKSREYKRRIGAVGLGIGLEECILCWLVLCQLDTN